MDDLVPDFMCEAAQAISALQRGVARLAVDPADASAAADTLRRLHGLKGLCGFMGFTRGEALAHAGESLLSAMTERAAAPGSLSLLSQMIERLCGLFDAEGGLIGEPAGDDEALLLALEAGALALRSRTDRPPIRMSPDAPIVSEIFVHDSLDRRTPPPWCGLDVLARALGDRLGKRIDLTVDGDDVRVASWATAALRTSLVALVRNACDHGVESPTERRARSKPILAVLHLSVHRTEDGVTVALADDGRGVDPARIRSRCVALGRLDSAAAAELSDAQAQSQIFLPGVTTATEVTALSGRGLGLEVVQREMASLGGGVSLSSASGRGAQFVITLPATVLATSAGRGRAAA